MSANGTKDMTTGNEKLLILQFAFPVFISQLFQQLYNIADSVIVGQTLGKTALAAVSSAGNLVFLIVSFFSGVTMGAGVVISRYFGSKDYDTMSRAIHTDMFFGLVSGIFLTIFGIIATPYILKWMNTDPDVLPDSILYFRVYFYGAIGMIMYNIQTGIMNAVGDSKRPLYYLVFSSCLNVGLDFLFIKGFGMGVDGAALATTISQFASAFLCLFHLLRKGTVFQVHFRKIRPHSDMMKEILRNGVPSGVQNSVIGLANVIVQSNINTFGADAMAGYGSYVKIEGFAFLPVTSFSLAMSTFISQNLGAGLPDRCKKGARFGLITGVGIAEVIALIIFIFTPQFISLFNSDANVLYYGTLQGRMEALFYFLLAFSHLVAGICRGAGKAAVPMVIMLSIWCVFRITYITVAMNICHDIRLIYIAYPLTWSMSSVVFFIYYKKSNWLRIREIPHSGQTSK